MNNEEFYQDKTDEEVSQNTEERMPQKNTRRGWSVAAFILSIISVLCCCLPVLNITLGAIAVGFVVISRIKLGYFDGLSIAALIIGVFGIVFGISTLIALSSSVLKNLIEEIMKEVEKQ